MFLKGIGVCLTLPWLETIACAEAESVQPRRMINITNQMGLYMQTFHPETESENFEITDGLKPMARHRKKMTVIKNLNLSFAGGHAGSAAVFSDMKRVEALTHPDGGITVDARAAEHFATATRFPMVNLWGGNVSFARNGSRVPTIASPVELFHLLFTDDSEAGRQAKSVQLVGNHSVLDVVRDNAKQFAKKLSANDRVRLDEYFTSVRDAERKIGTYQHWLTQPKPKADKVLQKEIEAASKESTVDTYDAFVTLIPLILQTDSSRIVTVDVHPNSIWDVPGVNANYHTLSHHGQLPEAVRQLRSIDDYHMSAFAKLVDKIEALGMLESTQLLYSSGMSDGNVHSCQNLPLILVGGGYKHGRMIDTRGKERLSNLYTTMLQRLGVETDHFNNSSGTLGGLV